MMAGSQQLEAAGGWCAPSQAIYFDVPVRPEVWPAGLTSEDLHWLTTMLVAGEIDLDNDPQGLAFPSISIRRGGITFPLLVEDDN